MKVFATLFALLVSLICVVPAFGQNYVELGLAKDGQTMSADFLVCKPVKGQVGVFAYAYGCKDWAEAYAGLTVSPSEKLQIAIGYGDEQFGSGTRWGGWVWFGEGKVSALHLFEDGASGPWHKTTVVYAITPRVGVGVVDKTGIGRGLRVEAMVAKDVRFDVSATAEGTELSLKVFF